MYIDDRIVHSDCIQKHLEYLSAILSSLWDYMLSLKCPKCDFFKSSLHSEPYDFTQWGGTRPL